MDLVYPLPSGSTPDCASIDEDDVLSCSNLYKSYGTGTGIYNKLPVHGFDDIQTPEDLEFIVQVNHGPWRW